MALDGSSVGHIAGGGHNMGSSGSSGSGIGGSAGNHMSAAAAAAAAAAGVGAGVVNYQISQQLAALKKSTQHCQVGCIRLNCIVCKIIIFNIPDCFNSRQRFLKCNFISRILLWSFRSQLNV